MVQGAEPSQVDDRHYRLEVWKYVTDVVKWVIAGLAAVISFYVIDVGKLKLETFKAQAENQRLLLQAYLNATESVQPDIWKRKLRVLKQYSDDERIIRWVKLEEDYIEKYAEQAALYREAVKVASQLAYRSATKDQREAARSRFEQLYWADLPYARESNLVASAMIDFRNALDKAETKPANQEGWDKLDVALLYLSTTLQAETPKLPAEVEPAKPRD